MQQLVNLVRFDKGLGKITVWVNDHLKVVYKFFGLCHHSNSKHHDANDMTVFTKYTNSKLESRTVWSFASKSTFCHQTNHPPNPFHHNKEKIILHHQVYIDFYCTVSLPWVIITIVDKYNYRSFLPASVPYFHCQCEHGLYLWRCL